MARWGEQRTAVLAIVTVVVAMTLAACGDDGGAAVTTTTPTTAPPATATTGPTTTTTAPDPTTIPDVIDEPYVQAVLDELYRVQGDAFRTLLEDRQVNETTVVLLQAIYVEPALTEVLNDVNDTVFEGFEGMHSSPGDVESDVQQVVVGNRDCILVQASLDFSRVAIDPIDPPTVHLHLVPASEEQRMDGNPTAWAISSDYFDSAGSEPANPCAD